MNFLWRTLQRFLSVVMSLLVIWVIVTQIFDRLDQRMPVFVAVTLTYFIAAYFFIPRVIHFTLLVLRRGRIPRFTRAADGLPADPVNILLLGSEEDLKKAFAEAGWYEANTINFKNTWKMIKAFILNKPYTTAPFSSLYLFGRKQDHGFQQPIGKSPRQRHHIRFWAANIDPERDMTDVKYWLSKNEINPNQPLMWVGAGTKDIGFGLTRLTYQITHAVDKNVDEEREYILSSLQSVGWIKKEKYYESKKFKIGKYISDGKIVTAELVKTKTKK